MIKAALRGGITSLTACGDVVDPGGARSPEESLARENGGKRPYPTGKPPLPVDLREAAQHPTVQNGVKLCWAHSDRSGCAKGVSSPFFIPWLVRGTRNG